MAVTYGQPRQIDAVTWILPVTSDRATPVRLEVYRDGVQIGVRQSADGTADLVVSAPAGTNHYFEVRDLAGRPKPASPGRFTLHWLGVAGATSYRIQEYVSSTWTTRATVPDDGRGGFVWLSRWLEDVTSHQFRVVAIDAAGNESTATEFVAIMVRRPDVPVVTVAKSAAALTLDIGA